MSKILVFTDNDRVYSRFKELVRSSADLGDHAFHYAYSPGNELFSSKFDRAEGPGPVRVKEQMDDLIGKYDLIISAHFKQFFPKRLVESVRCINIHPGFNPFNRGWYPQVFSIINGLPCGATIHEMDDRLDHGPVICQKQVPVNSWDTSSTLYERILEAEFELLSKHLDAIIAGDYRTTVMEEGNVNSIADFKGLCRLELEHCGTLKEHIDLLRALSHEPYHNAYFIDSEGNEVFISVRMTRSGHSQ